MLALSMTLDQGYIDIFTPNGETIRIYVKGHETRPQQVKVGIDAPMSYRIKRWNAGPEDSREAS